MDRKEVWGSVAGTITGLLIVIAAIFWSINPPSSVVGANIGAGILGMIGLLVLTISSIALIEEIWRSKKSSKE
jgi:hypothetical protein